MVVVVFCFYVFLFSLSKQLDEVISLSQSQSNQALVGGVEYFVKILHRSGNSAAAGKIERTHQLYDE